MMHLYAESFASLWMSRTRKSARVPLERSGPKALCWWRLGLSPASRVRQSSKAVGNSRRIPGLYHEIYPIPMIR